MENTKYGKRREGRWTPIRAKAQDTRANSNSWETHLVRKRWGIGLLRALSLWIMMMMMMMMMMMLLLLLLMMMMMMIVVVVVMMMMVIRTLAKTIRSYGNDCLPHTSRGETSYYY